MNSSDEIMETSGIFVTPKRVRENIHRATDSDGPRRQQTKSNHFIESFDEQNTDETKNTIIVSVVENRSRETCVCKIDSSTLCLLQIFLLSDNHSYNETIGTIHELNPDEILLLDGTQMKVLTSKLQKECREDARVIFISRQYFDQDRGAELLKRVLVGPIDADLIAKYTVLSGAYCLLRYIENCNSISFATHSVRVEYASLLSNKMAIDRRSAINLELISNARTGGQTESLFGIINHTKTVVGGRLLRSSILRPTTDAVTINTRLDFVHQLICDNRAFRNIVASLGQFPDLDKMLSGLTSIPKKVTKKNTRIGIDTLIYLKQALTVAPDTAASLSTMRDSAEVNTTLPLLGTLIQNLESPVLANMLETIRGMLTDSTAYSKSAHEMRNQECFALKTGINGLLDVSRKTFLQAVEDLYQLADKYSIDYSVPVKISYSSSRGYYLFLPNTLDPLPPAFTQAVLNRRSISCSTEEFASIANRAEEAIEQALLLTHELIQNLLSDIRQNIDAVFALADSVALVDMLSSFSDLVALSPHTFTRPQIESLEGPMVIKNGRHPVISNLGVHMLASSFVSNDTFISPIEHFHVLTGPNGSGKTVYIKQIALITIMAQIGCFVPAQHATIPIRDRILSRLGTNDDMEHNMSTFFTEMKEMSYLLTNCTDQSLIVIDELGRGTSTIDGLSIAWAMAEQLIKSKAFTIFVTHYPQITNLAHLYPVVRNFHMKTSVDTIHSADPLERDRNLNESTDRSTAIKFLHRMGGGPCDMKSGYGLLMAELCGFPPSIIEDAREVRCIVQNKFPILIGNGLEIREKLHMQQKHLQQESMRMINQLLQHLQLLKNSTLSDEEISRYLHNLKVRLPEELILIIKQHISTASNVEIK